MPQTVPFATGVPVSLHVCVPVLQSVTPTSQAFAGVQASPAVQALQRPPLQTRFAPQVVPFAFTDASTHAEAPVAQLVTPLWQSGSGLVVQAAPAVQATQAPLSQTRFEPHAVPFESAAPFTQVEVPVEQFVTPTWQIASG